MPRSANRNAIGFVLVTIFLDAIGFGLIMPVLPRLLMRVGGIELAAAIDVGAWMSLAMALATFLAAPVLGNLSDHWGRRPVLLIALAGLALNYLLLSLADTLALVVAGRVLTGFFGGSFSSAQAALADITLREDRARSFAWVSAAFGVGFIAGPAIGGLLSEFGERAPFVVALALSLANLLYGLIFFPETLTKDKRRPFALARANPFGAWRSLRASPGMPRLALVLLLWQIASLVYPLTWSFYGIAQLGWSDRMIGLSLAGVGLVIALSQAFVTGPAVRRFGERNAARIGLVGAIAGFLGYAFTASTPIAFALLACVAAQSLVQPSLMALISQRAAAENQGEAQGIAAMTMGLGAIIAPMVLVWPMAWLTAPGTPVHFPGVAYLIAALIGLPCIVLLADRNPGGEAIGSTRDT